MTAAEIAARLRDTSALARAAAAARLGPSATEASKPGPLSAPSASRSLGAAGPLPDPAASAATRLRIAEGRMAAVLVAILLPAPGAAGSGSVVLTLRSEKLSAHAGQVAFPGGRIEAGESAEAAALREAAEEIGLDPRLPEVVGQLPPVVTGTGFHVTPVVALLRPPQHFTPSPDEVQEVFELPLSVVLDPAAPQREQVMLRGVPREFWVWPHPRHRIWGATAHILRVLALVLQDEAVAAHG